MAYAIADSPFGPFERIGKILQQDESVGTGAGHHSVIQIQMCIRDSSAIGIVSFTVIEVGAIGVKDNELLRFTYVQ